MYVCIIIVDKKNKSYVVFEMVFKLYDIKYNILKCIKFKLSFYWKWNFFVNKGFLECNIILSENRYRY